ncbi:MAG: GGDEF domain-containing protein [Treponemataceae bacterium]|nr:GGDEF domain-containing protein [Treponemataceae bacterium]
MWCERPEFKGGSKEKLRDYITYFEGTCELCIGNMGINKYQEDVESLLENESSNDDEKNMLLFYIDGVIYYKISEYDKAFEKWSKAETYARKITDDVFLAKIFSYYAIIFYIKKDYDRSEVYFDEAASIFAIHRMYTELSLHYINYLWYKRYDPDKNEVSAYLDMAFYYVQLSNSIMDARVYLHLGYIYKTIFNDFIRGIGYLNIARDICFKNNNVEMESMTLHTLADGYMQLSHYYESVHIYEQLMTDKRYANITENLKCAILSNLIPCYIHIGNYEKANLYLEMMKSLTSETQVNARPYFDCLSHWLTAMMYIKKKENLDQVLPLLDSCSSFCCNSIQPIQMDSFDLKLAENYGEYWEVMGNYDRAIEYYQNMGRLAEKYTDFDRMTVCSRLSVVYEKKGEFKTALEYRKQETEHFNKIDRENILSQYDHLYKKFFKNIQDDHLKNLFETNDNLSKAVYIDELTNVHNRLYYQDFLERFGKKGNYSVIMIDLDYFKEYNDSYGHLKGDVCLKTAARIIKESIPADEYDTLCHLIRYGGEEFLILAEAYSSDEILTLAETIVKNIESARIQHKNSSVSEYLTLSAGCATGLFSSKEEMESIVTKADKALYLAKKKGRNTAVRFYGQF